MNRILLAALAMTVALAPPAAAQDNDTHKEGVTVAPADYDLEDPWVVDRETLAGQYPTVGRALDNLGNHTPANNDSEVAQVREFFESGKGERGLSIDGEEFVVMASMPSALPPGDDATYDGDCGGEVCAYGEGSDEDLADNGGLADGSERGAPGFAGLAALLAAAVALALVARRRA